MNKNILHKNYISIDGGTSNTRIAFIKNNTVADRIFLKYGAKDNDTAKTPTEADSTNPFKIKLKKAIAEIILRNKICEKDITAVVASGMITGEKGLFEVKHIKAPAGIKELHNGMVKKEFPEICSIPFYFIPGVKTLSENLNGIDIMRGEETELMGLTEDISNSLVILPGSHSKCICVSNEGKIVDFKTFLTGEMLFAIYNDTILKNSLNIKCEPDEEYLKMGFSYCKENGINEALFKTRILDTVLNCNKNQCYGFFMGFLLYGEVSQILKMPQKRIILAGKAYFKYPTAYLLKSFSNKEIILTNDSLADNAPAMGMIKIYEHT